MNKWITTFLFVLLPVMSHSQVINNFDTELDPGYFGTESSDNADPALSTTTVTTVSPGYDSPAAIQIEYSAHNSEGWEVTPNYITTLILLEMTLAPQSEVPGCWRQWQEH